MNQEKELTQRGHDSWSIVENTNKADGFLVAQSVDLRVANSGVLADTGVATVGEIGDEEAEQIDDSASDRFEEYDERENRRGWNDEGKDGDNDGDDDDDESLTWTETMLDQEMLDEEPGLTKEEEKILLEEQYTYALDQVRLATGEF